VVGVVFRYQHLNQWDSEVVIALEDELKFNLTALSLSFKLAPVD